MKLKQRHNEIVVIVNREGRVGVDRLAALFGVSAETVRRDLTLLADAGQVRKVHGGAQRPRLLTEPPFDVRMGEDASAKLAVADKLADIVAAGETLFIDTGSTTLACARRLSEKGAFTVITNSVHVARMFERADNGSSVYLLGGRFSAGNDQTLGPVAIEQIADFQTDRAILTVAALNAEIGAMDASFEEAQVARAMRRHTGHTTVVATARKLGRTAAFRVCRLDELDTLVTDRPPDPAFAAALAAARVEVR